MNKTANEVNVTDSKTVWAAWTNTDRTEGRGYNVPVAVCELKSTAIRLGKGKGVQGSNCGAREHLAVRVGGQWLVPGTIVAPTSEDVEAQKEIDLIAVRKALKEEAIARAKKAGLSDEDIALLAE